MRFDPNIIRQQISNLLLAVPELAEDDVLRADMIEAETDAREFLTTIERKRKEAAAFREAIAMQVEELCMRQERYGRREAAMRALILETLKACDTSKLELPEATLSVGKGRDKVVINDPESVPITYCRVKQEPNLTKIKQALETGVQFNWAALVTGEPTLTVRVK